MTTPGGKRQAHRGRPNGAPNGTPAGTFRLMAFLGFVLAGFLTLSLSLALKTGSFVRAAINAILLWFVVNLILRNLDNMAAAEGRRPKGHR